MIEQRIPFALDGAIVRLFPGFARWRAVEAAARSGRDFETEQMLFDAGRSILSVDLFAGFWRDEAGDMDWLEDFLCDPAVERMVADLQSPPEEEEEAEALYTKTYLVTVGNDMSDY